MALAIGAFGIGTTEFTPMGLLPNIAQDVGVSIPAAGLLVSAYAMGVTLGAPIMTLIFTRFGNRTALMSLMAIFALGNLVSALAPDYGSLLLARVLTSLSHGAFFGLGSVVASSVVSKEKQAAAVAIMFMGLSIANIGGVPIATWIGQNASWRYAFAGTATLGFVTIAALWLVMPKCEKSRAPNVRQELRVLVERRVLLALGTTVMGAGAMFTLYTFIAPTLIAVTAASDAFVAGALIVIGIGFTLGNGLGGRVAQWSLDGATKVFLASIAGVMLFLPITLTTQMGAVISLFLWGAVTFALVPAVQTRVMQVAVAAPGLASAVNIGAFNLGNALGAAVGGGVINYGLSYKAIPLAGAFLAVLGLMLVFWGTRGSDGKSAA